MFKPLAVGALACLLVSSTAATAGTAKAGNQGALAPGKAASVERAELFQGGGMLLPIVGGGLVIGGIVLAVSGNSSGSVSSTTNCPVGGCSPTPTSTSTSTTTATTTTH